MSTVSLKINGRFIEGMDDAQVKLTLNNISPVTMTGDSVAFSATIKVPRTPENDSTFSGLNKGLLYCEYYDTELYIRSLPFKYMAGVIDQPAKFYAKVSADPEQYTINLVESTDKWSDVSRPISSLPTMVDATDGLNTNKIINLSSVIRNSFNFPQNDIPALNPTVIPESGVSPFPRAEYMRPTIACERGTLTWAESVVTGNFKFIPRTSAKGRGGYVYSGPAQVVLNNPQMYMYSNYFGATTGAGIAGFNLTWQTSRGLYLMLEYTGATIPTTKPIITLGGLVTGVGINMTFWGKLSERVWIYYLSTVGISSFVVYPRVDTYFRVKATVNGVVGYDYFKFPDGYAPEEIIQFGEAQATYNANLAPQAPTVYNVGINIPLTDAKTLVDDLCTAFHWRKIFKDNTLVLEPIMNPAIRDKASNIQDYLIDWSDNFVSHESTDIADEFADQYVCMLGDITFSHSNGSGTIQPVKEAYKSGLKYDTASFVKRPYTAMTDAFNGGTSPYSTKFLLNAYYPYIQRHFKMFSPRVQVKVKAILDYETVENIRLDRAYYFSQLSGYFYLKSLGEYNVDTGECKLSLYKLDL